MDVNDVCSNCKKAEDQMLMLSCVHDLCINCAANSFAEQIYLRKNNPEIFICEFCSQETDLDISTTTELNNLAKVFLKTPTTTNKKTTSGNPVTLSTSSYHPKVNQAGVSSSARKKEIVPANGSTNKKMTYFCEEHNEEEISYYCFSCQMNICPECAIHGSHKDHDVKLMKKALSEVKGSFTEIINEASLSQNGMNKCKEKFIKIIKETNERTNKDKVLISKEFENIRASLLLKEKQMIKNIEELNKQNINLLTSFLETMNIHYEEVSKVKKSVELILRKDEVLIFEEFKKIEELSESVKEIKQKSDEISGELVFLNAIEMEQWIQNIGETISSTKQSIVKEYVCSGQGENSRAKSHNEHLSFHED